MRSPHATRWLRTPLGRACARGLAATLAVAFVATQLAVLEHEASERHAICAEHGELIDLPASAPTAGTLPAVPADHAAVDPSDRSERALGDHHCAFAPVASQARAAASPSQVLAATPAERPAAALPVFHVAPAPAVALYRLAPKTSPPV